MSDLVLNALQRKLGNAEQLGNTELVGRINKRIASHKKEAPAAEVSDELADRTKAELLDLATEREIEGRSQMTKSELLEALQD